MTNEFIRGRGSASVDRRTVVEEIIAATAGGVTGCLESSGTMDETTGSGGSDDAHLEVLGMHTGDVEESASVRFEDDTVTVTGTILGSNTCYTARIDAVTVEDRTLLVAVESYEDVAEGEGCRDARVAIEYQATVEVHEDPPTSVRVEHNGDPVTTERRS